VLASAATAVEANLFSFFQHLASWPRVRIHDDGTCGWTTSDLPFPLFNSVFHARLDRSAEEVIDARLRDCRGRRAAMLWWTGPSSTPANLGERLAQRGFMLEPAYGMHADLDAAAAECPIDRDVSLEAVEDEATLATWCRVLCTAFGAPQAFGDAFGQAALAIGLGPDSVFRHFLARVNGEPAATGSLFLGAGVAGIYDVATVPEQRRRGIGAAVTRTAMAAARESGYRMAILHASAAGAGLYRSLGFTDVCAIGQHVWVPDDLKR
jgi:ribosomal protein S18 acetylase RimI-like enzyme